MTTIEEFMLSAIPLFNAGLGLLIVDVVFRRLKWGITLGEYRKHAVRSLGIGLLLAVLGSILSQGTIKLVELVLNPTPIGATIVLLFLYFAAVFAKRG